MRNTFQFSAVRVDLARKGERYEYRQSIGIKYSLNMGKHEVVWSREIIWSVSKNNVETLIGYSQPV